MSVQFSRLRAAAWMWSAALMIALASASATAQSLPDFRVLVRENQASVVNIFTTRTVQARSNVVPGIPFDDLPEDSPFREFFKRFEREIPSDRDARSLGSGFIVSADGKILTNAHVVEGADEIRVKLSDRTEKVAKVLGIDKATDVALLKIDAKDLRPVKFGDSDRLEVGEWVLAIGSPFSLEYTATHGIVSALGRELNANYVPFIQTDVPVNPGNSGGPLFNMRGEVVGINSQIYSRTGGYMGLSFAIPMNIARSVEAQLEKQGYVTRGWLGVQIQNVTSDLAKSFGLDKPRGALIGDVDKTGPASRAGVRSGDIILEYDGRAISERADLPSLVAATPVGKTVPLKLLRDGKNVTINVTVAALKTEQQASRDVERESEDKQILNVGIAPLTDDLRKQLDVPTGGVLIAEVRPGPAARAGIQRGDVLLKIDGKDITGPEQFVGLVKALPRGKPIPVLVHNQRGGRGFVAITLPTDK
jgi:serine protease Do